MVLVSREHRIVKGMWVEAGRNTVINTTCFILYCGSRAGDMLNNKLERHAIIWLSALIVLAGMAQKTLFANAVPVSASVNSTDKQQERQSKLEQADDMAGLVLGMSGGWKASRDGVSQNVKLGDAIYNGWRLEPVSKESRVTVVLVNGTKLNCPGCSLCTAPIAVSKAPSATSTWWTTALNIFSKEPVRASVIPMSRQLSSIIDIQDAVVNLDNKQIDLTPAVTKLTDGTYYLRMQPVAHNEKETSASTVRFVYRNGTKPILPFANGQPGLYRMVFVDPAQDSAGEEAWLLATDSNHYTSTKAEFQKAADVASQCKDDVPAERLKTFVRACMEALNGADSQPHK